MKAKRVLGIVAAAALSISTVIGPAMPAYADAMDETVAADTSAPTGGEVQGGEAAGAPAADTPVQNPAPAAEAPIAQPETAAPAVETPIAQPETTAPASETVSVAPETAPETVPASPETVPETTGTDSSAETNAASEAGDGSETVEEVTPDPAAQETEEAAEPETETGEETEKEETESEASSGSADGEMTMTLFQFSDDEGEAGIAATSLEESKVADTNAPEFTGIAINGDFSQWDGVEKTTVDDDNIKTLAMVFDKDVYIYIEGQDVDWGSNDIATGAGIHNDGMFVLTTDTGREFVFFVRTDGIYDRAGNRVEDSEVYYDNATHQFEVKIPSSVIKQYKETISLGYYLDAEVDGDGNVVTDQDGNQVQHQIIADVADLSESGLGTVPNEIVLDGLYGDWDTYHHTLIEYSTAVGDAEGAMYADGENLMMHVKTYLDGQSPYLYKDITLRFNRDDNQCVNLTVIAVDNDGNVMWDTEGLYDTTAGKQYHYYIVDENAWNMGGQNIYNDATYWNWNKTERVRWLYGEIDVNVNATGTEMEVKLDMSELANRLGMDQTQLKYIQAQFENIGQQWISCAGTSTGPIPGILMGVGVVAFAAWGMKKKEEDLPKTTEE